MGYYTQIIHIFVTNLNVLKTGAAPLTMRLFIYIIKQ